MKHDHLNVIQISRAIVDAGQDTRLSADDVRTILNALPDHPGPEEHPHPEIEFDEVRKGDRIDVLTIYGNREILTVEARTDVHLLAMGTQIPVMNYIQSIRLIDRPVVHPDPAECPVIIVHKELAYDFTQTPDGGQAMMWNGDTYENADYEFFCKDITDWSPAKVTPLED